MPDAGLSRREWLERLSARTLVGVPLAGALTASPMAATSAAFPDTAQPGRAGPTALNGARVCNIRDFGAVKMDGLHIFNRVNGNNDGFHFITTSTRRSATARWSRRTMRARCSEAAGSSR